MKRAKTILRQDLAKSLTAGLMSTVAVAAIVGLSAGPAAAQEATVQEQGGLFTLLGRIILGAGVEKVAINTPQAVTVLNQEDIDRAQASTPAQLFSTIPGVQPVGSERAAGLSFNIRGIGTATTSDESRIIVSIDGAPKFHEQYNMGSFFSDPELFKRVEVLRGPASSTLHGAGALGGVINFTTKDASDFLTEDDNTALRTRLSFESNGEGVLASVIYAQGFSDQFETLLALNRRTSGQFKDGDGVAVVGSDFTSYSALLKGTFYFGDANEQSLRASFTQWQSDLNDTQHAQVRTADVFGTIDRKTTDQTFVLSYENPASGNPFLDLDVTLSWSDTHVVQSDSQGAPPMFAGSPLFSDGEYAYRSLSLRVENTFEMGGANWENFLTAGVQVSNQEREAITAMGQIGFHPQGSDQKIGLYVQSEFTFGERLTIIPGARIDFTTLTPDASVVGGVEANFTAFSPKIQAMYKINDAFSVFGSLARTERTPTIDEVFSTNRGTTVSLDLETEKANSVELGFTLERVGLFSGDDVFSLKTTAFHSDVTGMIITSSGAGTPNHINGEDTEIWGVELEAAYQSERMFGQMALSFVDGTSSRIGGETPRSIPAPNLSLTLGGRTSDLGLEYGWTGNFVSDITTTGFGRMGPVTTNFTGYATHGLFVGWKPQQGILEGADLRLSVSNMFDRSYSNNLSGDMGRGRTFKLTVGKTF